MNQVIVNRDTLLNKITANRETHLKDYQAAKSAYRSKVTETLKKRLDTIVGGGKIDLYFNLPHPVNYTSSYDEAIEMLKMSVETEIKLSAQEFKQFVLDQWTWADNFARSTKIYNAPEVQEDND